ncbi:MAG: hypothetical protein HRT74_03525, partial [Flavobacteriales bacterium]|nr:hypothetical protein [Flavobacteriales bacterium]
MKRILVSIYFLILTGIVTGQEVEVILEFNVADATGVDEVEILDVTPDRLVIAVRSNDFSLNNGYSFQNEEANEVILFCDASLNVIWSKSFKTTIVHDAIIGSEGIYLYLESIEAIEVIEDDLSFEKSAVITKVDFNGDFIWSQEYGGIQRIASSGRSLALDGGENLLLATGLWNYVHPSSPDTLVFNDEICYCDALALDFSDCVTTLKWDSDGNELAYHILSSQGPSRALDVGADAFGNYYVSGRQDISPSSPIFAGTEIDGGEFLLAFDSNDSQKWVYHRSDQLESYNSERIGFIHADEEHVYLDIEHSSNEVVTDGQSILLNQPIDGQLSYQTIHVIESNSGDLESIDLIGHYTGYSHIRIDEVDNFYTFGSPYLGFEHDFSPYAHSPNSGDRVVTSKQILGAYYEPVIIEADALNRIDCYFNGRYYLELARSQYCLQPTQVKVILFLSQEYRLLNTSKLNEFLTEEIEVEEISRYHHTLFQEPYIKEL